MCAPALRMPRSGRGEEPPPLGWRDLLPCAILLVPGEPVARSTAGTLRRVVGLGHRRRDGGARRRQTPVGGGRCRGRRRWGGCGGEDPASGKEAGEVTPLVPDVGDPSHRQWEGAVQGTPFGKRPIRAIVGAGVGGGPGSARERCGGAATVGCISDEAVPALCLQVGLSSSICDLFFHRKKIFLVICGSVIL